MAGGARSERDEVLLGRAACSESSSLLMGYFISLIVGSGAARETGNQ
tara:strand:+ start:184 stop:324 length:141 start_codon:yes stop_codon:yes gene_type:complete